MTPDPQFTKSADGTEIAFYDFGGNGPDLVLGHATGFCSMVWLPVIEGLKSHFRCVGYDLRGHGLSQSPGDNREAWNWDRYAQDAAATIAAAKLDNPFSVGHSSGAATALLLEQAAPTTFRAIFGFEPVMFDANPPTGPDENRDLALRALTRRRTFPNRKDALENFSKKGPFKKLNDQSLEAYVDFGFAENIDGEWQLRCRPEDEAAIYVMASAHTGFVNLPSVECPVTVMHGADSIAFGVDVMQKVAANVQNGTFLSMPNAGHFGALEQTDEFVSAVLSAFQPLVATHQ